MTKFKKSMKAVHLIAGVCGALSIAVMVIVVSHGFSSSSIIKESNVTAETTIQETTEELVLSSVEAAEVATVTAVNQNVYSLSEIEYDALLKIVEAEAGGEDDIGKILVANVVLNRAYGPKFADTVLDVIYSPGQFTPTQYSDFNSTQVSEATRAAVDRALAGEDYSQGALYFCANSATGGFSGYTLVLQHGGQTFFK